MMIKSLWSHNMAKWNDFYLEFSPMAALPFCQPHNNTWWLQYLQTVQRLPYSSKKCSTWSRWSSTRTSILEIQSVSASQFSLFPKPEASALKSNPPWFEHQQEAVENGKRNTLWITYLFWHFFRHKQVQNLTTYTSYAYTRTMC